MILKFDESFLRSLEKITDQSLRKKIPQIISNVENAASANEINQIKKLKGYKTYYRIKSGNYRIGIELAGNDTVVFIIVLHRKDIYNRFP